MTNGTLDIHRDLDWNLNTTALRFIHEPTIYQGSYVVYNNTYPEAYFLMVVILWYNPSMFFVHFHGDGDLIPPTSHHPNYNIEQIFGDKDDPTMEGYITVEPVYNANKYGPSHKAAKVTINNYGGSASIRIIPLADEEDNHEFKVEAFS